MRYTWYNSVLPIAAIFSFRMLGLFMLIPVFTIYAPALKGATPVLIGVALGIYGLTQGLLQIPMGYLSDRISRKSIIALGLTLFAMGSIWGALTDSIYGMILARALQGTGAIGSVLIALLADLTTDTQRTKSMAVIGASIGISFSLAMIISPSIATHYNLSGIFYVSASLAISGLILLFLIIPTPTIEPFHELIEPNLKMFKNVLNNPHLFRLDAGIFCQHFILTATFFAIPLILQFQISAGHLSKPWHFYLSIMILSFLTMLPFIRLAERKKWMKWIFFGFVAISTTSQLGMTFFYSNWYLSCVLMFLYFVAFNFLEASLPSIVSRQADMHSKGTAMGVYSTSQFIGIFFGGVCSGILFETFKFSGIFLVNACISTIWLIFAWYMQPNQYSVTLTIHLDSTTTLSETQLHQIQQLTGVQQIHESKEKSILYVKVEHAVYEPGRIEKLLA